MKVSIITAHILLSISASMAGELSSHDVANLLGSEKTAPCLAQLHKDAGGYDISVNSFFPIKSVKNKEKNETRTAVVYNYFSDDMMVGMARITVIEKLVADHTGNAPEGTMVSKISGCEFNVIIP